MQAQIITCNVTEFFVVIPLNVIIDTFIQFGLFCELTGLRDYVIYCIRYVGFVSLPFVPLL
jgi:hypothetical protein